MTGDPDTRMVALKFERYEQCVAFANSAVRRRPQADISFEGLDLVILASADYTGLEELVGQSGAVNVFFNFASIHKVVPEMTYSERQEAWRKRIAELLAPHP